MGDPEYGVGVAWGIEQGAWGKEQRAESME
jgi:hypothetical protein